MELTGIVDGVIEDLRRAGAIGGEETARVADLLAAGLDASLRLHILEALHAAAREMEAAVPGLGVDVRLDGREPVLVVGRQPELDGEPGESAGPGDYADDELLRLTIRLPQGLKSAVEQAATATGASINSWIVSALARMIDTPSGRPGPTPGRRLPRRMTGFVQG